MVICIYAEVLERMHYIGSSQLLPKLASCHCLIFGKQSIFSKKIILLCYYDKILIHVSHENVKAKAYWVIVIFSSLNT